MASFTDDIMAVADVYANGFLRLAHAKGEQDQALDEFADLISYMDAHPDFDRFLTSSTVDKEGRRATLDKLFRGKLSDRLLNLLMVLNDRGRLEILKAVFKAVQVRIEAERAQQRVLVETAMPLTDDLRARVKDVMSRRMGKEALVDEQVNPALIGGIVIHIGDERIDASLAQRIRTVRQKLSTRGSREIHQGNGKYLKEG
jgi:F-type H+-transporting ATPase subunit delta